MARRGAGGKPGVVAAASPAHLRRELRRLLRRVGLAVPADVPAADVLHRDVLHVEAHVVTRQSLAQGLVVHLHGFHLSGDVHRGKGDHHARPQDSGLHSAHGDCANPCGDKDRVQQNSICLVWPWARTWIQQKQDFSSGCHQRTCLLLDQVLSRSTPEP